jgi:hypothetical protein
MEPFAIIFALWLASGCYPAHAEDMNCFCAHRGRQPAPGFRQLCYNWLIFRRLFRTSRNPTSLDHRLEMPNLLGKRIADHPSAAGAVAELICA